MQTNSQWRYATLHNRVNLQDQFTVDEMRENSASVSVKHLIKEMLNSPDFLSIAANVNSRTLWYALYDLTERTVQIDFYLNSNVTASGEYEEVRSSVYEFHVPSVEVLAQIS